MPVKAIQISLDPDLLGRIDADPEARENGRSAFLRTAARLYLEAKRRQAIDRELEQAFSGSSSQMVDEVSDLIDDQAWPVS